MPEIGGQTSQAQSLNSHAVKPEKYMTPKTVNFEVLLLKSSGKTKKLASAVTMEDAQCFIKLWKQKKPNDDVVIKCEFT